MSVNQTTGKVKHSQNDLETKSKNIMKNLQHAWMTSRNSAKFYDLRMNTSTNNGIQQIINSENAGHTSEKYAWIFVTTMMTFVQIVLIVLLIIHYLSYPYTMTMRTELVQGYLPDVSVCSMSPLSKSVLQDALAKVTIEQKRRRKRSTCRCGAGKRAINDQCVQQFEHVQFKDAVAKCDLSLGQSYFCSNSSCTDDEIRCVCIGSESESYWYNGSFNLGKRGTGLLKKQKLKRCEETPCEADLDDVEGLAVKSSEKMLTFSIENKNIQSRFICISDCEMVMTTTPGQSTTTTQRHIVDTTTLASVSPRCETMLENQNICSISAQSVDDFESLQKLVGNITNSEASERLSSVAAGMADFVLENAKVEEAIQQCYVNGKKCNDKSFEKEFMRGKGVCFAVKLQKYSRQTNKDSQQTMDLRLRLLTNTSYCYMLCFDSHKSQQPCFRDYFEFIDKAGYTLVVHEPGGAIMPQFEGISLDYEMLVSVNVRLHRIAQLGSPFPNCKTPGTPHETWFYKERYYRQEGCVISCLQSHIMADCTCILQTLVQPNDVFEAQCDRYGNATDRQCLTKTENSAKVRNCDCPIECTSKRYELTVTKQRLSHVNESDVLRYTSLRLNIAEHYFLYAYMVPTYDLVKFISELGVRIGLAGMSIMTIFEMPFFFCRLPHQTGEIYRVMRARQQRYKRRKSRKRVRRLKRLMRGISKDTKRPSWASRR